MEVSKVSQALALATGRGKVPRLEPNSPPSLVYFLNL